MSPVSRLTRMRWAVRAVLALGVAASVTANVLHAHHNPISQAIAGWPPVALLLTVELISRIPVHRRALAAVRLLATAVIAGIATWVSYWHMVAVAARYGETGGAPYLLPLSVDGLILVASICLVEIGGRLATITAGPAAGRAGPAAIPAESAHSPASPAEPAVASVMAERATTATGADADAVTAEHPLRDRPAGASPVPPAGTTPSPIPPAPIDTSPPAGPALPTAAPSPAGTPSPAYEPISEEDTAMYLAWRHGVAARQEPSGVDLARAAGRADDATGVGRRAARRYREAHARDRHSPNGPDQDAPTRAAGAARPTATHEHRGATADRRHNGHDRTHTGTAR